MSEHGCNSPSRMETFTSSLQKTAEAPTRRSGPRDRAASTSANCHQGIAAESNRPDATERSDTEVLGALTQTWEQIVAELKRIADAINPPESPIVDTGDIAAKLGCKGCYRPPYPDKPDSEHCIVVIILRKGRKRRQLHSGLGWFP